MMSSFFEHGTVNAILAEGGALHEYIFGTRGSGDHTAQVDATFLWIFWVAAFFFVVLMGLTLLWSIQYRRRGTPVAPVSSSHNTVMETLWTVIPLGILAIMFFKGFKGYLEMSIAPAGAIEMDVRGAKWDWRVIYPNGAESTARARLGSGKEIPVFYMPAETPVKLRMISSDVLHSFWIPDFRGKFDVMPNRYTSYSFTSGPIKGGATLTDGPFPGTPYEDHWLFCAEYCGDSHSEMAGIIRLVPRD
ncbi:MAG: cytochrome c oxidase subunit II, partial [Phycisphaerae bacterium]|nr:cytochrome c oxidase subunit II [Phycisphaerae bacterium]